jgi:hypothetical protein
MIRIIDTKTIFEIICELGDKVLIEHSSYEMDEWDELMGIHHKFIIEEIINVETYKSGDKWMLKYTVRVFEPSIESE